MKILMISHSDTRGGAARAAYRLHRGLRLKGLDSQMLVQEKLSGDASVSGPASRFQKAAALARLGLDGLPAELYRKRTKSLFSPGWVPFSGILQKIKSIDPDIIHLHWVAGGMLKIEDLALIKKPIVWSLHDMWAFTGGCHTDEGCGKFADNCGKCHVLGSVRDYDLSRQTYNRKMKAYAGMPGLAIVGLSSWSAECALGSTLLSGKKIINLPNPIDLSTFKPVEKKTARNILNLPESKKLICFGALDALDVPNKGFSNLVPALRKINRDDIELIIFGGSRPLNSPDFGFPARYLGTLHDDISLRLLYSATDATIVPSFQENLSNVIMESMACGTPVAAFRIGGNPDMIEHKINGYLAKPYEISDLARGIEWILDFPSPETLSKNSFEKIKSRFEINKVTGQYLELYKNMLENPA